VRGTCRSPRRSGRAGASLSLGPGSVDVGAVVDAEDNDPPGGLVDLIDHAVRTASGGPEARQVPAQRLTHAHWSRQEPSDEELGDRRSNVGRQPVEAAWGRRRQQQLVLSLGHEGTAAAPRRRQALRRARRPRVPRRCGSDQARRRVWASQPRRRRSATLPAATKMAATSTHDASSARSDPSAPDPRPAVGRAPLGTARPGRLRAAGRLHRTAAAVERQAAAHQRWCGGGQPSSTTLPQRSGYAWCDDPGVDCPASGQVPASLRRPLRMPPKPAGGRCRRTTTTRRARWGELLLGPGPVYAGSVSSAGPQRLIVLQARGRPVAGWRGFKTRWVIDPSYPGPVLLRGRALDGPTPVGFGLDPHPGRSCSYGREDRRRPRTIRGTFWGWRPESLAPAATPGRSTASTSPRSSCSRPSGRTATILSRVAATW
jgi:hypothetical protein